MDEAVDSTFELPQLGFRWVRVVSGASSSALEATPSRFTRLEATSERSRSHSKPPGSPLEPARSRRKPPRASRSRWESSPRGRQAREYSRKLDKTEVGATWASRASGASRWLLPEPLEPRDGRSPSLGSLEMGALGASGASRWVLFEPLERRDGRSQSLWSLEIAAPRAFGASR